MVHAQPETAESSDVRDVRTGESTVIKKSSALCAFKRTVPVTVSDEVVVKRTDRISYKTTPARIISQGQYGRVIEPVVPEEIVPDLLPYLQEMGAKGFRRATLTRSSQALFSACTDCNTLPHLLI